MATWDFDCVCHCHYMHTNKLINSSASFSSGHKGDARSITYASTDKLDPVVHGDHKAKSIQAEARTEASFAVQTFAAKPIDHQEAANLIQNVAICCHNPRRLPLACRPNTMTVAE